AGYELTVQNGKISTPKKYWDVYDGVRPHIGTEAQIMEELDHLLRESVALRKQSDVPYGVYLSGGVDSSANVAFLADQVKEPVKTFSVGYENNESHSSYKNEFPYSRMVADRFQCDRHEIEITQHQFIDFSSNLTKFIDEPNADIVTTSLYYVSQLAKDSGVTVCLGGEGSDELFCGYIIWRHSSQFSKAINISKKLGAKGLLRQAVQAPLVHSKRPFYRNWLERLQYGKEIFWGGAIGLEEREKRALFSPTFLQGLGGYSSWESIADWHNDFEQTCPQPDALNWMSYLDLKFRLPDLLLHRLDKMSMAASIEARVPFLDSKLIQFAMGIPTNLKIRKQEEKYILKKTLEKRLPKEIIYRNKIGFGAPIREWFGEDLGALAHKKILHFNRETHLFRPEALEKWLQGRPGAQSWQMFVVALWWEKYFQ
ncbi:MAG: asparagine synthase C-terminal domain-containing protein, partial [Bacteroidota bacterium]